MASPVRADDKTPIIIGKTMQLAMTVILRPTDICSTAGLVFVTVFGFVVLATAFFGAALVFELVLPTIKFYSPYALNYSTKNVEVVEYIYECIMDNFS